MIRLRDVALVAAGGGLGALARAVLDHAAIGGVGVPWDVVAINIAGSAGLGVVAGVTEVRGPSWLYPLVGTGFLGGFTTFSALAALEWSNTAGVSSATSLLVLVVSVVASVAAAAAGWAVAGWRGSRDAEDHWGASGPRREKTP